jgi:hypothetical protein
MARWQVRKVTGKKTLQIWDDKHKTLVAESPAGSTTQVAAVIAALRLVVGDYVPGELVNVDDQS